MTEAKKKRGRPPGSKNKTQNKDMPQANTSAVSRLKDEIWAIVIMALGAFLVISLQTEAAGQLGHILSGLLKGCFGHIAYVLPYYLILYGLLLFAKRTAHISGRSVFFLFLIFLMLTLFNSSRFLGSDTDYSFSLSFISQMYSAGVDLENGGAFGMTAGYLLIKIIGITGLYIFSAVVVLISLMLVINTPVSLFFDNMKAKRHAKKQENKTTVAAITPAAAADPVPVSKPVMAEEKKTIFERKELKEKTAELPVISPVVSNTSAITENQLRILDYMKDDGLFEKSGNSSDRITIGLEETTAVEAGMGLETDTSPVSHQNIQAAAGFEKAGEKPTKESTAIEELSIKTDGKNSNPFQLPHIDLLAKTPVNTSGENENLKAKAAKLEQTLLDFNVNAKVMQVTKGPAVTRYEIQPSTGVKVSSIVRLSDDIALNLEAKSIRIEAPIPGKAAVGIEVENERVNLVAIREIIESVEYKSSKSKISFAVGKDIAGKSIVADLKSMPHLLIAGSTGSGKSVCINSIIISMLYKAKPDEVKFVLIDPKVVELNNYNGIPHLLIPVVTEPGKAAAALNWAVAEMTERYKKFAEEGVRDLEAFNNSIKKKGETERLLPQIVIIIDELADLMMAAPSQVEESICRLAQMARAAGMHLIVATQRPSVDIITGVIKANIPSRIAFAVSSQFDSRTILDMSGAEKLVGKGDMLFHPMGTAKPFRVQGTFISDSEVHRVIEYVKCQVPDISYSNEVIHSIEKVQTAVNDEDTDELLPDAIETVVRAEQASVSMLQRRFRIGYNRAARLIDMMEARGIIGPADGSRPRKVLLTENEFLALSSGGEES